MSRNGSGVYSLPAGNPVVTLTAISTTWANTTLSDIANELTNSIDKAGRTAPTANLSMAGFKHTNVAAATGVGEYLVYGGALNGTDLTTTGNTILGNASTDTLNVGNGGIIKDASGNVGLGGAPVGRLSVVSTNAGASGFVPGDVWGTSFSVFGPNAGSGTGGALAVGYDSTSDFSCIVSLTPTVAWRKLKIFSAGLDFLSNSGSLSAAITSDGRLYGTALHNNAGAVTGTTNQYIASGTYTPTLANIANTTSRSAGVWQWMRVGNVVTVSGRITAATSASGGTGTSVSATLPIALAGSFGSSSQIGGVVISALAPIEGGSVADFGTLANLTWGSITTASHELQVHFTYLLT